MAVKIYCDLCGDEIDGCTFPNSVRLTKDTHVIICWDLCDKCIKKVRENLLKLKG